MNVAASADGRWHHPAYGSDMISGFVRFPDGQTGTIASVEEFAAAQARDGALVWVDLDGPTEEQLYGLGTLANLHPESLEDCLSGEQRPRIDELADQIFIVFYGLFSPEGNEVAPRKLAAFCGPRFLITVHREALRTVRAVLERCRKNPVSMLGSGIDTVLYHIIDGMVDKYLIVMDTYEKQIEELEESSLDPDADQEVLVTAASLRRELLDVRSLAVSQREMLMPVAKGEYTYISESLELRFSHVCDHLTQVVEAVDALREQLHGVRDYYHTGLANRTNAAMKMLTLVATLMLPPTLIAGIYGMNLPLWPQQENPLSFWGILAAMLATSVGLIAYFRKKNWL